MNALSWTFKRENSPKSAYVDTDELRVWLPRAVAGLSRWKS